MMTKRSFSRPGRNECNEKQKYYLMCHSSVHYKLNYWEKKDSVRFYKAFSKQLMVHKVPMIVVTELYDLQS